MRKIYLLLTALVFCSIAGFSQNYNVTTSPQCNTTAAGNEIVNFTGATPNAVGNGTITMYFKGDFDGKLAGNEYLDLYGETGPIMANTTQSTTGISNTQCATAYDSIVVPVTMADLNNWATGDGTITFTADGASGVSVTCPAPGTAYCVYMRLEYPRASGLNDIGVASLNSPGVFCAGAQNISVTVQNYGLNQVNSAVVNWTWNGVAQTPVNINQLIDTANGLSPNNILIPLGTKTINDADTLVVWTSSPNGGVDTTNINDTLKRILAPSLIGTYTINSALATGGTNYQSFTDFVNYLVQYGICGPVIANVASGSGPYNEQINIPSIVGSSSINTLTINGNGATLTQTLAGTPSNYATLNLDGADYVTVNNLNIEALGATLGFGIHLMNSANYNTFNNCNISVNPSSTGTTSIPVSMSGSTTSYSSGGVNGSYNLFDGCTLSGGYFAMSFYGLSGSNDSANKVTNCTIKEYYLYGIYGLYQSSDTFSHNILERPTRTAVSTGYGIVLTTGCVNNLVEKNIVRSLYGGAPVNTNTTYALYCAVDGAAGRENKFINNLVYNIQGSGTLYAMYLSGADYVQAYNNTIVLDDMNATAGATYGIYNTGTLGGIDIKNNNISITRGGTGAKYCLYYTGAGAKSSNYNNLYINSAAGSNNVGYNGSAQATLANWQAATGAGSPYDANSVSVDPIFTSTTNYTPTNAALDNLGTPLTAVPDDILGVTRSATTPDIGAYEFTVPFCTSPPTPGTANITPLTICSGGTVQFSLNGNSVGIGQTFEWQSAPAANGPFTAVSTAAASPAYSTAVTSSAYYRAAVTCGSSTTYSDTVLVTVPSLFPGGTYTIGGTPGPNNFATFADASLAINCGIAGPIIFNVAPGTYNEQVNLPATIGSNNTNTVTFNGNGATLQSSATTFNIDGADYITVNNLNIGALSAAGFAVHLMNGADNNSFNNCNISADPTATGTTSACVSMSGSTTTYSTAGVNGSNNSFDSCNLTGGYFGFTFYGSGVVATADSNNNITNCTVKEYYLYGTYNYYQRSATISNSIFERPTRTTVSTGYGILLTTGCTNMLIQKNIVRSLYGGAPVNTNTTYALYCAVDGTAGRENKFINNLVYNIQGSGTLYAMYLSGADYVQAYNNTIVLDDLNATAGATYGIYNTGTLGGIDIKNNNISITRGGTGAKYCLYYTGAGAKSSNYNNLYINSSAGSNNVGYDGAAKATLANWQASTAAGSPYDANSVSTDPMFVNPAAGDYKPASAVLDNLGTPLAAVPDDILGVTRSASTPDIGAYEYTPPTCLAPSGLNATNSTATTIDLGWTTNASATQWQIEYQANVSSFTIGTGTRITVGSNPYTLTGLTAGTPYAFYVRNICAVGDSSTWSGPGTFITAFPATPPNDPCSGAVNISTMQLYAGTTSGATQSIPACDATNPANDVWYSFTTGNLGGSVTITINTTNTGLDAVLQTLSGSCSGTLTPMIPTASTTLGTNGCIDGPVAGIEFGTYTVTANTTYYVRVYTYAATAPGSFTIQATGSPLATRLSGITATNVDNKNRVDWQTASENEGDYFILERSDDGRDFTALGIISAKGEAATYSYWDESPLAGVNHYRLKMMDASGNFSYSETVTARVKGADAFTVEVYPNPVSDMLTVTLVGSAGSNPTLSISDATGKLVKVVSVVNNGASIDMAGLAQGVYILKYSDNNQTQTIKVNKQ